MGETLNKVWKLKHSIRIQLLLRQSNFKNLFPKGAVIWSMLQKVISDPWKTRSCDMQCPLKILWKKTPNMVTSTLKNCQPSLYWFLQDASDNSPLVGFHSNSYTIILVKSIIQRFLLKRTRFVDEFCIIQVNFVPLLRLPNLMLFYNIHHWSQWEVKWVDGRWSQCLTLQKRMSYPVSSGVWHVVTVKGVNERAGLGLFGHDTLRAWV